MNNKKSSIILNHTSSNSNLFEYFSKSINLQSEKMLTFIFSITEKKIIEMIKNENHSFTKNEFEVSATKKDFKDTFGIHQKFSSWKNIENELNSLFINSENTIDNIPNLRTKIFNKINFKENLKWIINPFFLEERFMMMKTNNFFITSSEEVRMFTSKHTFKLFRYFKSKTFLNNKMMIALKTDQIKKLMFGDDYLLPKTKQKMVEKIKEVKNNLSKENEQPLMINNFWNTTENGELWWNFEVYHSFDKLKKLDNNIFKNMRIIDLWRRESFEELKSELEKQFQTKEIKIKTITEDGRLIDHKNPSRKSITEIEEIYDDDFWELDEIND